MDANVELAPRRRGQIFGKNFPIVSRRQLSRLIVEFEVLAPDIAEHHRAGQFIMMRTNEAGERVAITVAWTNPQAGTITVDVKDLGASSHQICQRQVGETFLDVAGPFGQPTKLKAEWSSCLLIGGGVGTPVIVPQAIALAEMGVPTDALIGGRDVSEVLHLDRLRKLCRNVFATTDDGSRPADGAWDDLAWSKGFIPDYLTTLLSEGRRWPAAIMAAPTIAMKKTAEVLLPLGTEFIVSLPSPMVCAQGMCSECTHWLADGSRARTCVDGPEFDARDVDFDTIMRQLGTHHEAEQAARALTARG